MIKAILLQILLPVWEALRVHLAYHCNHLMYAKHILLHHLIIPLLDLIQSPNHGIIIVLVAECPLHVHQQVPHRDVLALIQHASPFSWVPTETSEDRGHILASSYCSRKASTLKHRSVYVTSTPGSVDLKIGISNLMGTSHFLSLLPLQPLCLCQWPAVSLTVDYPSESGTPCLGRGGQIPFADCSTLGLRWLSMWSHGPCTGGSLASVLSPIPEVLPSCGGVLPTSWLEESDSHAAPTDVLWVEFSTRLLSLRWFEVVTDHCHTSIGGRR